MTLACRLSYATEVVYLTCFFLSHGARLLQLQGLRSRLRIEASRLPFIYRGSSLLFASLTSLVVLEANDPGAPLPSSLVVV